MSVPGASGTERLWVGLRAPLVQGLAVLLRTTPVKPGNKRLGFDGIALVDLRGNGVRELTLSGGSVWGIAGSAADSRDESLLFRIGSERLQSGNVIGDTRVVAKGLPPTAEGLIVQPEARRAIVLLDGDLGKTAGTCRKTPQQLTITDLPE